MVCLSIVSVKPTPAIRRPISGHFLFKLLRERIVLETLRGEKKLRSVSLEIVLNLWSLHKLVHAETGLSICFKIGFWSSGRCIGLRN